MSAAGNVFWVLAPPRPPEPWKSEWRLKLERDLARAGVDVHAPIRRVKAVGSRPDGYLSPSEPSGPVRRSPGEPIARDVGPEAALPGRVRPHKATRDCEKGCGRRVRGGGAVCFSCRTGRDLPTLKCVNHIDAKGEGGCTGTIRRNNPHGLCVRCWHRQRYRTNKGSRPVCSFQSETERCAAALQPRNKMGLCCWHSPRHRYEEPYRSTLPPMVAIEGMA